mmetsp:Transcript_24073/g.62028  ORF Transcript_24073/g.62028 Transcript_24073/m.62028 type:complete len:270 (-) Transcript_24073:461-1270(-)
MVMATGTGLSATKSSARLSARTARSFQSPAAAASSAFIAVSRAAVSAACRTPHVFAANSFASSSERVISTLSKSTPSSIVHSSKPTAPMGASDFHGAASSKCSGFGICRAFHSPLYAGFSTRGGYHLPLYSGLDTIGARHSPQPGFEHFGLATSGASHSPSSSSSQSVGMLACGSGISNGSSSCQSAGLTASGSGIWKGASSSQSSGLRASGSSIMGSSTQSSGFTSVGSSISLGGMTGGSKCSSSERSTGSASSMVTRSLLSPSSAKR